jgi:hypothetical protein
MNTKSKNFKVAPEFEELFSFSNDKEKLEHRAQMISYRILSEVEKVCEEQNIMMKDLAKMVNTSASYITQLFRGNKQVNTAFMARFEEAMNMAFTFAVHKEKEMHDELSLHQFTTDVLKKVHNANLGSIYCFSVKGGKNDQTNQILETLLDTNSGINPAKQIA